MEWFVRAFIKAAVTWLTIGVTLGVAMAAVPSWLIYRPSHLHVLMLGFVAMMIFGVAYHVIPRFSGHALRGRRAAMWHWWIANAGLVLMATGFALRPHGMAAATPMLVGGGLLAATGAYIFMVLIWRTIDGPRSLRRAAREAAARTQSRAGQQQLPLARSDER